MVQPDSIYIGTSGWSYPKGEGTWKGYFYPGGKLDELQYYSQFFNTVEINSSFYRPPNPGFVYNWARKTPSNFLFTAKLWQKFTHPEMYRQTTGADPSIQVADIDLFKSSIEPLVKAGKLGALLAQFPPSFHNDSWGQKILLAVMRVFGEYRLAVELRHRSWSDDPTTATLLKEHNVCWVQIDEPKFSSSIAPEVPVTSDMSYFRFHGRNAENWWQGNAETRYQYLYSPEEIKELSEKVRKAGEQSKLLFAFFNNHWKGWAPKNATDLKRALQLPLTELPVQAKLENKD